jgi:SAM-dependent methyltransferase
MSEVLEHLDDAALAAALGEVRRLLVPGGRLLLTVPHDEHLPDGEVICPCCGTLGKPPCCCAAPYIGCACPCWAEGLYEENAWFRLIGGLPLALGFWPV